MPGQFLAVERRGRALMIASLEMIKLVYVVNRDLAGDVSISSPHEANRTGVLCFGICGIESDRSYAGFAALEIDCVGMDDDDSGQAAVEVQKHLTLYCLDLGMNTCTRRISEPVQNGSNLLISIPRCE